MKKILIIGLLLFTAIFLAGVQQGYAYQQVTSTPDGGCLNCHPTTAGTGLHTVSAHSNCASCHPGSVFAKNVATSACIVCHPNAPDTPGKCTLINFPAHPKAPAAQSCLTCHATCAPAECIDADNDTYGANCPAGPDCDDTDTTTHAGCCIDADNDTYGADCPAGPDCDDTDTTTHAACCIDNDGDGYGDNCTAGPDCDDTDNTTYTCEIDCTLQVTPKRFSRIRALLQPFEFFAIRADRDSSISFANPICIFWESEGIDDVIKLRIGEKLIIGYVRVWASHLTDGDFKVSVTFGDTDETQCGPIEVTGSAASSFIQSSGVKLQNSCGK